MRHLYGETISARRNFTIDTYGFTPNALSHVTIIVADFVVITELTTGLVDETMLTMLLLHSINLHFNFSGNSCYIN